MCVSVCVGCACGRLNLHLLCLRSGRDFVRFPDSLSSQPCWSWTSLTPVLRPPIETARLVFSAAGEPAHISQQPPFSVTGPNVTQDSWNALGRNLVIPRQARDRRPINKTASGRGPNPFGGVEPRSCLDISVYTSPQSAPQHVSMYSKKEKKKVKT